MKTRETLTLDENVVIEAKEIMEKSAMKFSSLMNLLLIKWVEEQRKNNVILN